MSDEPSRLRAFAEAWPDGQFVQEVLARLPWYHQFASIKQIERELAGAGGPGELTEAK